MMGVIYAIYDKNWGELFDFFDGNKNGSISIVEFLTTMDHLGEADDYGKSHKSLFSNS